MKLDKATLAALPREELEDVLRREIDSLDLGERFTLLHELGIYHGDESLSGYASSMAETSALRAALPDLLRRWEVQSLLDLPCGDFHWMQHVDLGNVDYTGVDVVPELVERNNRLYGGTHRRFLHLDATRDPLPKTDLVLCRDLLIHLSLADMRRILGQIVAAGPRLLLVSHFSNCTETVDIVSGDYHPVNLCAPPFHFPPPIEHILEHSTLADGALQDRGMGLWKMEAVAEALG
jgi:SAM-dependent methyltransferase